MIREIVTGVAVVSAVTLATGTNALAQKSNPCAATNPK